MTTRSPLLLAPVLALAATPAAAEPIPDAIKRMVEVALASGDAGTIAAVVGVAKRTVPESAGEIDAMAADWNALQTARQAQQTREAQAKLAAAGPLSFWNGEVELGGSRSTGNSEQTALYGALRGQRDGINWRHTLTARADVQTNEGVTNTERAIAAWQPNYKFGPQLYLYGQAQYEHDRFLGYSDRGTLGAGLGYTVVNRPGLKIDLEGGPALRHTAFYDLPDETTVAGRASVVARWQIGPTLAFAQDAALYIESGNSNAVSTTSLDTTLIGDLKARFSYNVRYERDAPPDRDPLDTITRASLVYGF